MNEFLPAEDQKHPTHSSTRTIRLTGSTGLDDLRYDIMGLQRDIATEQVNPVHYLIESTLKDQKNDQIRVRAEQIESDSFANIQINDGKLRNTLTSSLGSDNWQYSITSKDTRLPFSYSREINSYNALEELSTYLGYEEPVPVSFGETPSKLSIVQGILALKQLNIQSIMDKKTYLTSDYTMDSTAFANYMASRRIELNTGRLSPSTTYRHLAITSMASLDAEAGVSQRIQFFEKIDQIARERSVGIKISLEGPVEKYSQSDLDNLVDNAAISKGEDFVAIATDAVTHLRSRLF